MFMPQAGCRGKTRGVAGAGFDGAAAQGSELTRQQAAQLDVN